MNSDNQVESIASGISSISIEDNLNLTDLSCYLNADDNRIKQLVECFRARLDKVGGEFLLQISPKNSDDEDCTEQQLKECKDTLTKVSDSAEAVCIYFDQTPPNDSNNDSNEESKTATTRKRLRLVIRKKVEFNDFLETRIAVLGNVDAGKSTLLGVLTHGQLDDGRGSARQHLLRHLHEQQTGRTSSVGCNILGFDNKNSIVNEKCVFGSRLNWSEVCYQSGKVISFLDLAGHERYLKTTIFGLTGLQPHCAMLMVGGNAGLIGMGREHLGLCLALSLPLFVVVSKIDSTPANVLQQTVSSLQRVLRSNSCRRTPLLVRDMNDVWMGAEAIVNRQQLCPIFQLSSVNGQSLDLLKRFLSLLSSNDISSPSNEQEVTDKSSSDCVQFQIEETYSKPGVGTVVSGLLLNGRIVPNDSLLLGPDKSGKFNPVKIKSIHRKRLLVEEVNAGQSGALALKKVKKSDIRKGMVILSPALNPQSYWEFIAEVIVLHHPTTISKNYQAMVHTGNVRQTASISHMSKEYLRTGDRAKVHFRFVVHPEYIKPGQRLVFREGRTKAIGNIIQVIKGEPPHYKFGTRKMLSSDSKDLVLNADEQIKSK